LDYTYVEVDARGNPDRGRINLIFPGDGRGSVAIALDDHGRVNAASVAAPITAPDSRGPVVLQDHGTPVRFRNVQNLVPHATKKCWQ
jgi:hypothetical protein